MVEADAYEYWQIFELPRFNHQNLVSLQVLFIVNVLAIPLIALLGSGLVLGSQAHASEQPNLDGMPRFEEFERSVHQYPYLAPAARSAKMVSGLKLIARCMQKDDVAGYVGQPDFSRIDFGPKGPGEKLLGSTWMYYLKKKSSSVNLYDTSVEMFFDTKDRLVWLTSHGIDGAHDVGGTSGECRFTFTTTRQTIGIRK